MSSPAALYRGFPEWKSVPTYVVLRSTRVPRSATAMATNSSESPATPAAQNPANIITALGNAFKNQNGEPITGERIAQLLAQNMGQLGELARQGKLNPQQIQQVRFDHVI